ncbi:hypothetical protein, partial [Oceanibaculum nanhaiense]|uniref:hypothetical protein n=1 Tax=Oceanibaculum nanhaiense TaxID=1909734 RepID=UPI00396D106E
MATREPADDIQALKNDLAALRKDIGALAKTVGDQASTTSDDVMDGLKERVAALRSELEGAATLSFNPSITSSEVVEAWSPTVLASAPMSLRSAARS